MVELAVFGESFVAESALIQARGSNIKKNGAATNKAFLHYFSASCVLSGAGAGSVLGLLPESCSEVLGIVLITGSVRFFRKKADLHRTLQYFACLCLYAGICCWQFKQSFIIIFSLTNFFTTRFNKKYLLSITQEALVVWVLSIFLGGQALPASSKIV